MRSTAFLYSLCPLILLPDTGIELIPLFLSIAPISLVLRMSILRWPICLPLGPNRALVLKEVGIPVFETGRFISGGTPSRSPMLEITF